MIVGIVGRSEDPTGAMCSLGTGKDTVADILTKTHGFTKVGMADPLKRFCLEVYDFTEEQLWGPSAMRNKPDKRYPRNHTWRETEQSFLGPEVNGGMRYFECECCGATKVFDTRLGHRVISGECFLTPRFALQQLGTEWGRNCWEDTWIRKGLETAKKLEEDPRHFYDPVSGLAYLSKQSDPRFGGVVFSDVRFKNELKLLREYGGKVILVLRKVDKVAASEKDMAHQSENDLNEYGPGSDFWDEVIYNDSDLSGLKSKTRDALGILSAGTE